MRQVLVQPVLHRVRRLRDWRVRSKLAAAVLVPTIATAALAGTGITSLVGQAGTYARIAQAASLARGVAALVHEVQLERDLSAGYLASSRERGGPALKRQRHTVDSAVRSYRRGAAGITRAHGAELLRRVHRVNGELAARTDLRSAADNASLTRSSILAQYSSMIRALLDVNLSIAQQTDDHGLTAAVEMLGAFSLAKEYGSQVRAGLYGVLESGSGPDAGVFAVGEFEEYVGAIAREQTAIDRFRAIADPDTLARYADLVRGDAVGRAKLIQDAAIRRHRSVSLDLSARQWFDSQSRKIDLMRRVELRLLDTVVSLAGDLRSRSYDAAVVSASQLLTVLVLTTLALVVMVRTMTRPMRVLRTSALDTANRRLPELMERLRRPDTTELGDAAAQPTGIDSADEIGEVARAFDEVNRATVRLAADQVSLHQSVNSMLVGLSRRGQGLVERQLRLIDELEGDEENPDQLENLFKLDHLATRMRRTHDSLSVLAGAPSGRHDNPATVISDVVMAAVGEVEQYRRITRGVFPELLLAGYAVNDVVHLLVELLENATVYSPPETEVMVSCGTMPRPGGVLIEIADRGVGMSPEELRATNQRLSSPAVIDADVVRRMGLFVVARIASKHRIRVELLRHAEVGLTARVVLPASLLTGVTPAALPAGRAGAAEPSAAVAPQPEDSPAVTSRSPWFSFVPPDETPPVPDHPTMADSLYGRLRANVTRFGLSTAPRAVNSGHPPAPGPRPSPDSAPDPGSAGPPAVPAPAEPRWPQSADAAWRAAAGQPSYHRVNGSGLPVREPLANLISGSLPETRNGHGPAHRPTARAGRGPDAVRSMLSTYYDSYLHGRDHEPLDDVEPRPEPGAPPQRQEDR